MEESKENRPPGSLVTLVELKEYLTKRSDSLDHWSAGTGLTKGVLTRVALREIANPDSKLRLCTPESIYSALTLCAEWGLEPGGLGAEAYLIPYRNKKTGLYSCSLQLGYPGLIRLLIQAGAEAVWAKPVFGGDEFEIVEGTEPKIFHKPAIPAPGTARELVAAYACAKLKSAVQFEVLFFDDIEKIRKGSQNANEGPWVDSYVEMARKSALRRLAKYLPKSPKLTKALAAEDRPEDLKQIAEDD